MIASFLDMMNHDACAGTAVLGMRAGENPATIWQGVEGSRVGGLLYGFESRPCHLTKQHNAQHNKLVKSSYIVAV